MDSGEDDLAWHWFDPTTPSPVDEEPDSITVDDIANPFSDDLMERLLLLNVLRESNSNGIDIYEEAKTILLEQ